MNTSPSLPPQPPPLQGAAPVEPLAGPLDTRALFEGMLRQPAALLARLQQDHGGASGRLVVIAAVAVAVFGLVLGTFAGHEQLWAAPLKVVSGLLLAALICFPSLYIFSCLSGSRIGAGQLAVALAGALALAGILLLGFAPALWIFTQSTNSLGFMGFLALAAWLVALGFGIGFVRRALVATGAGRLGPLAVWSAIFVLVTLQMSTSLRPILGRSDVLLTQEKKFFLEHWIDTAGKSLATSPAPTGEQAQSRPDGSIAPASGGAEPTKPTKNPGSADQEGRNPFIRE